MASREYVTIPEGEHASQDGPPNGEARTVTQTSANAVPNGSIPATSNQNIPARRQTNSSVQRNGRPARPSTTGRHSSLTPLAEKLKSSFSPSTHDLTDEVRHEVPTARKYLYRRQRGRLWLLSMTEFFLTILFCVTYFLILYEYQKDSTISVKQRRIFNALTTGNSLLLGVNLAASLRSYAKMLRWRILAADYRPLETFDLVMGCDSIINVLKLLLKTKNTKRRYLPSRTQIWCVIWIIVNLAVTVFVGMIGLTYNLDTSQTLLLTQTGNTSVIDLSSLLSDDYYTSLSKVQQFGDSSSLNDFNAGFEIGQFDSDDLGNSRYYFVDVNPVNTNEAVVTNRYLDAQTYCTSYMVVEGQYGNMSYVVYEKEKEKVNQTLHVVPGLGGLVAISNMNSTCGARCTNVETFQAQSDSDADYYDDYSSYVDQALYFVCNNTMSVVSDQTESVDPVYQISDTIAKMLAGAIGWSQAPFPNDSREYVAYGNSTDVAFSYTPTNQNMSQAISWFTVSALAPMDDTVTGGLARMDVPDGGQPIEAQYLNVQWRFTGALLGGIPALHFLTLLAVILWANKAIIKDDSHLCSAKVYHNLLKRLDDHGCMLRHNEIEEELNNPRVVYGWIPGTSGVGHTDVFTEDHGVQVHRAFEEGWYDGCVEQDREKENLTRYRERYRDIDALEYF